MTKRLECATKKARRVRCHARRVTGRTYGVRAPRGRRYTVRAGMHNGRLFMVCNRAAALLICPAITLSGRPSSTRGSQATACASRAKREGLRGALATPHKPLTSTFSPSAQAGEDRMQSQSSTPTRAKIRLQHHHYPIASCLAYVFYTSI